MAARMVEMMVVLMVVMWVEKPVELMVAWKAEKMVY